MIYEEAKEIQDQLVTWRRALHQMPELGCKLPETTAYIAGELEKMGISHQVYPEISCITALIGNGPKCILLRSDTDGLPLTEKSGESFASTNGCAHACGHDLHAATLLGAAKLLKKHEKELNATVKLLFQPGEETLEGAESCVRAGVLENPHVDAAMMIHSMTGMPMPHGVMLIMDGGRGMASCDQYKITVKGKGGHGAMPHLTIDPITAAAHIHVALAEIHSRELTSGTFGVITTGKFQAGVASNVIADTAVMEGTIRTGDEATEAMLMQRVKEIAESVGKAYRCEVDVEFVGHCPPNISDTEVSASAVKYMTELLGQAAVPASVAMGDSNKISGGSEDFAFISTKVPSVSMMLAVGNPENGYCYPQHHPKARFDDSKLFEGAAAYAYVAARWLEEHQD